MKKHLMLLFLLTAFFSTNCDVNYHNEKAPDGNIYKPELVEFTSADGLMISANIYEESKGAPVIVLCHQARFNKFEYAGIAEKLMQMGFNCIAIDQRSGGPIGDKVNETTIRAIAEGKSIDYIDAEPDIIAAINYAVLRYNKPVILWGSSYSSTLALYIAINNDDVNAVVSFSPGDYLSEYKGSLVDKLEGFNKPMFVTSSLSESSGLTELVSKVRMVDNQIHFIPKGKGHHGSRALWNSQIGSEEYWVALSEFLQQLD